MKIDESCTNSIRVVRRHDRAGRKLLGGSDLRNATTDPCGRKKSGCDASYHYSYWTNEYRLKPKQRKPRSRKSVISPSIIFSQLLRGLERRWIPWPLSGKKQQKRRGLELLPPVRCGSLCLEDEKKTTIGCEGLQNTTLLSETFPKPYSTLSLGEVTATAPITEAFCSYKNPPQQIFLQTWENTRTQRKKHQKPISIASTSTKSPVLSRPRPLLTPVFSFDNTLPTPLTQHEELRRAIRPRSDGGGLRGTRCKCSYYFGLCPERTSLTRTPLTFFYSLLPARPLSPSWSRRNETLVVVLILLLVLVSVLLLLLTLVIILLSMVIIIRTGSG